MNTTGLAEELETALGQGVTSTGGECDTTLQGGTEQPRPVG